jgi:hypothetical protein
MSTISTFANTNTDTNNTPNTNAASSFPSLVGGSGTVYSDPSGNHAEWVRKVNENHEDARVMVVSARSKDEPTKLIDVQASSIEEVRAYPTAIPVIPALLDPVLTSPGFDVVRTLLEDPTVKLSKREIWSVTGRILDHQRTPNNGRLASWVGQYRRGRRMPDRKERPKIESVGGSEEGKIDDSGDSSRNNPEVDKRTVRGDELEEGEIHDHGDSAGSASGVSRGASRHKV